MSKNIIWHIGLFVFSVLIQVLFMDNIQFYSLVNPYFYVLFILLLPINTPRYLLLILGFALGLTIDVFANTPGIHASATVFMAFLRPFMINTANIDEQEKTISPTIMNMGVGWFIKYSLVLILFHHTFLFFVEIFSFHSFLNTILRSVLSGLFTFVLILLSQFIIYRK
ncbi:MAG: rod shape-determining protein MreD [Prolixibacteraceae bacterium]|nr:rod shape-determining protein MreD [Prolixibacteraceae bacterium]MBN2649990.1 rod shape-determining protein MreD [Prolixibacteraceae bacterium]